MAEQLKVKRREKLGGGNNRRLRRTGNVPAVLYGHGEACIPLAVESTAIMNVIRQVSLAAIAGGERPITLEDITGGIHRELAKEGKGA